MTTSLLRLGSLLGILALSPAALAGTLYVDANLTTGLNDGSSWANAFQTQDGLQAAFAAAVSGDDIFVAAGSYRPSDTGDRAAAFRLLTGVNVYGGFAGDESAPIERPPFGDAESVLTGDLNGDDGAGFFGDNVYHVVRGNNTDATAVLDGFTVTSGNANVNGSNRDRGGGILCVGATMSPTIRNCRFIDHRCTFGGAAGYINNGATPTFTNCTFEDSNGNNFGGAFDIAGGGAVQFDRCFFRGNTADRGGALEIFATSGVVVSDCVFIDNVATGSGGGGGLWMGSGGNTQVINCTVINNSSTTNGVAGIRIQNANNSRVMNCVIYDNSGPGGAQASNNQVSASANVTYSIVEGGFTGTGNLSADPLIVDAANGDYGLSAGSPGIDAGDNSVVTSGGRDFDGDPRQVDDPATADTGVGPAPVVDIGAVEFGSQLITRFEGCFGNPHDLELNVGLAVLGEPILFQLSSGTGAITDGISLFYVGLDGTDLSGCGLPLPGLGEVLLNAGLPITLLGSSTMAGSAATLNLTIPAQPSLVGLDAALQAATVGAGLPGFPTELSDMLLVTLTE